MVRERFRTLLLMLLKSWRPSCHRAYAVELRNTSSKPTTTERRGTTLRAGKEGKEHGKGKERAGEGKVEASGKDETDRGQGGEANAGELQSVAYL